MEAALRASERRFRAIFNQQFEFSGLLDREGRVIELSDSVFRGTGVTPEEVIGKLFLDGPWWRDLPEARARWRRQFEEALARPGPSRDEAEYRTADGAVRYALNAATALRDEEGQVEFFLVEGLDITDRKRAENALRESEERLRLTLEASHVVNWSWDAASNRTTWDERFYARYKVPLEAPRNFETWIERVHPEDRPRILSRLEQMRATPGDDKWDVEFRSLSSEGRVRWHQDLGKAQRDASGAIAGLVGIDLDITDRKKAENALRESEELLRRVSNNADVGLTRCSRDWVCLSANPAYAKIIGKPLDQIIGRPLVEVVGAETCERVRPHVERVLRGENVVFEAQLPFDGAGDRYLRVSYTPDCDAEGRVVGWVGCVTDITDRKAVEEALRLADRRKDEFLAILAHELRNPLAPIVNGVQILQSGGVDAAKTLRLHEMMARQAKHLVRLVDDLLEVSRVNQGLIELRKERIDLAQAVNDGVAASQSLIAELGHDFTISLPPELLWLDADPTRVVQVVSNLVSNACKFTEPGGHMEISARAEDGYAVVSVRDNGIGIPSNQLTHVFDLFSQIDNSLTHSKRGLGVGLALVRKLAELHGGHVEARSEGVGRGAEFVVRLPLPDQRIATSAEGAVSAEGPAKRTAAPRVLVVDDNRDVADSLCLLVETLDAKVRVAYDGQSALQIAAAFKPDVVFLDLMMPEMDGYETATRLRRLPEGREISADRADGLEFRRSTVAARWRRVSTSI